jgi:serine/threonine protein kinase
MAAVPGVLRLTGGAGTDGGGRAFFVAQLLGLNLAQAARAGGATPVRPVAGDVEAPTEDGAPSSSPRWTAADARSAARDTLDALAALHAAGFLHRDVKPSNFGWLADGDRGDRGGRWTLFDFGLAAPLPADGRPPPPSGRLTGSATYASPGAHEGRALGRRDDAWGWLFMVVEHATGTLPWRGAPDRAAAAAAKRAVLSDPGKLVADDRPAALMAGHPDPEVAALMASPKRQAERVQAVLAKRGAP